MNTRSFRTIAVLFVIATIASLLTACSAAYSESDPASVQALQLSPRINGCGASARQGLINAMKAEANPRTAQVDGYSIGEWLSGKMETNACIVTIDEVED